MPSAFRDLNMMNNLYRKRALEVQLYNTAGDATCGVFVVPSPEDGGDMLVIASSGSGWDHVSISHRLHCPTWKEMAYVKKLFFHDTAPVMELHVPETDHINIYRDCLHLWHPHAEEIPRPPGYMVGPQALKENHAASFDLVASPEVNATELGAGIEALPPPDQKELFPP
jgi:hypothetical protein